jgi:hypothetical protein
MIPWLSLSKKNDLAEARLVTGVAIYTETNLCGLQYKHITIVI